jgi:polyhydroxyalkanoate synthase
MRVGNALTADIAVDAVAGTDPVAIPSLRGAVREVGAVFGQLRPLNRAGRKLAGELVRIGRGSSTIVLPPKDWRFADPSWRDNPAYRRLGQSYLAACSLVTDLLDELAASGRDDTKARFLLNVLMSAAAPTNVLVGNPAAMKRALETSGSSLVRGARNWVGDLRHNGGMPSIVDREAFEVGRDLALTPGAVIDRDPVAEIIQFRPVTDSVRERPVLVIPPPIGRYYFLDLRPGRSFVEYTVSRGQQTFLLSWKNPGKDDREWDLETYAARVLSAIDTVRETTGSPDVNLIGFCAGGIIMTLVLNHLAATSDERVHSSTYAVTLLDFGGKTPIAAFSNPRLLAFARQTSRRKGIIDARSMGLIFTLMRPNELVWNYWVNNYLMGNSPPVFDILAWNANGTNLPAALHAQFLDIFENNTLCEPGAVTSLGTPLDLSRIKVPIYVVGALADHLTPWTECYRTTQLLSGPATFVLSNAGHIQSLVNPPSNPKASYFIGGEPGPEAQVWLDEAQRQEGSWWVHWVDWVTQHSGAETMARESLGSEKFPAQEPAPGLYVRDEIPA